MATVERNSTGIQQTLAVSQRRREGVRDLFTVRQRNASCVSLGGPSLPMFSPPALETEPPRALVGDGWVGK